MPTLNIKVDHKIGQEQAQLRIKTFLPTIQQKYSNNISNLQVNWTGLNMEFNFIAVKMQFHGKLSIQKDFITISGKIPLTLILFKGLVEKLVKEHAADILK